MDGMVNAHRHVSNSGQTELLESLLERDIVVPAKTVGLSDCEESIRGKVVDIHQDEDSLWCTVAGDKRWYCWHVDDVRSWLLPMSRSTATTASLPAVAERRAAKRASKSLTQSPPGRPQRPQTASVKPKPRPPGPEHLWKYCKRCNTWKERPGDFSKNHRTPDGLQFYCRHCHNRMTKFNQQRRLEDQHIAQKQQGIRSPKASIRSASTKSSPLSGGSVSPKKPARAFNVISSKIPRQQRTHATYRRESDELPSARAHSPAISPRLPNSAPAALNFSPDSKCRQTLSPKSKHKKEGSKFAKSKASFKPEAQASAELMLQANAVLEELDRVQAAEAAATTAAAAAIASFSSGAAETQPHSPAVSARQVPPWSPFASRFKQTAVPHPQANLKPQQPSAQSMAGTSASAGAAPSRVSDQLARQHSRSFSMPGQQGKQPSSGMYSLSQTEAQLYSECQLDTPAPASVPPQAQLDSQQQNIGAKSHSGVTDDVNSKGNSIQADDGTAAIDCLPVDTAIAAAAAAAQDTASLQTVSEETANGAMQNSAREACATSPQASAQTAQSQQPQRSGKVDAQAQPMDDQAQPRDDLAQSMANLAQPESPAIAPESSEPQAQLDADSLPQDRSPEAQPALSDPVVRHKDLSVQVKPRAKSSPPGQGLLHAKQASSHRAGTSNAHKPKSSDADTAMQASPSDDDQVVPDGEIKSEAAAPAPEPVATSGPGARSDASAARMVDTATAPVAEGAETASEPQEPLEAASTKRPSDPIPTRHPPSKPSNPAQSLTRHSSLDSGPRKPMPVPSGSDTLPNKAAQLPSARGQSDAEGSGVQSQEGVAALQSLSGLLTSQQVQELVQRLQQPGAQTQVAEEVHKLTSQNAPKQTKRQKTLTPFGSQAQQHRPATAGEAVPQLQLAAIMQGLADSKHTTVPPTAPQPKKAASKKRKAAAKADASNAMTAASDVLNAAPCFGPSSFPMSRVPSASFSAANLTTSIPVAAFGNSAVRVTQPPGMAGGVRPPHPSLGGLPPFTSDPPLPPSSEASGLVNSAPGLAPGPVNAALELSLLLTTLQSLANMPEEGSQSHSTIAASSNAAYTQLRAWLAQLQHLATLSNSQPSAAQQAQEDAAIAGQVRGEMWGNLQGILSMLAGQGCSPHVQDMIHQIAVHFANEQSQSVAVERRLTSNLTKEKEAHMRMQQQLQGGIQVLTAVQRVLGAVRLQHQRDTTRGQSPMGPDFSMYGSNQRVAAAERAERAAQQAVKALQRKEGVREAELQAAQTSNAQLHKQVTGLMQQNCMLEKQLRQCGQDKDVLHDRLATLQADNTRLTQQLSNAGTEGEQLRQPLRSSVTDRRRSPSNEELSSLRDQLNSWR